MGSAFYTFTLKHNNEELRNTNGCDLVTQFSSNPNNRLITRIVISAFFFKKNLVGSELFYNDVVLLL